jgi:hypothetical protein
MSAIDTTKTDEMEGKSREWKEKLEVSYLPEFCKFIARTISSKTSTTACKNIRKHKKVAKKRRSKKQRRDESAMLCYPCNSVKKAVILLNHNAINGHGYLENKVNAYRRLTYKCFSFDAKCCMI